MECIDFNLSNRIFFGTLENAFSDVGLINYGVPQGSISRSLLFLIYVNDVPYVLNETGSYIYVDDICIWYQDKDVEKIEKVLNKEFSSLCEWFLDDKLLLHFGDDEAKTIALSQKPTKTENIVWSC